MTARIRKRKSYPKSALGQVAASRKLYGLGEGVAEITAFIGLPREGKDGVWDGPFLIDGLGNSRIEMAHGVDSMQALLMAIAGMNYRLDISGRRFTQFERGRDEWDTGFRDSYRRILDGNSRRE
jgi:hypothetical protein